jgi:hypothetical protein
MKQSTTTKHLKRNKVEETVEEPKQETLEEIILPIGDFIIENTTPIQGADGAYYHYSEVCKLLKLQAKKMYSEEEVQVKLYECLGHFAQKYNIIINGNEIDEWFNQFKKK